MGFVAAHKDVECRADWERPKDKKGWRTKVNYKAAEQRRYHLTPDAIFGRGNLYESVIAAMLTHWLDERSASWHAQRGAAASGFGSPAPSPPQALARSGQQRAVSAAAC